MANRFFPFYGLGYRCNPFRALTYEEWAAVAVVSPEAQRILDGGYRNLQVLGEKGYGKTTLLLAITAEKRAAGCRVEYEYIPEGRRRFQTGIQELDYFALDEAQRLDRGERKRLLRRGAEMGLILGVHEDFASVFAGHGLSLTTIELGATDWRHLRAVLNRRLDYFALDGVASERFSDEAVQALWGRFGRDIRAVEQYLYEQFQERVK